jgi:hypothetical protein
LRIKKKRNRNTNPKTRTIKQGNSKFHGKLETIIKEYKTKEIDEEQKAKAKEIYKKIEERKAAENKKYHMYQY